MDDDTPLDHAYAAMMADPESDRIGLAFYDRLAGTELFLLLAEEALGDTITPEITEVEGQKYVLAFDREDRLAQFSGGVAPFASLSGRAIAAMLEGQELGLALNPGVAISAFLIDSDDLAWLAQMLSAEPQQIETRARAFHPPDLSDQLIAALDTRLAAAGGLADFVCLVMVDYADGTVGHMLGFVDALPGTEPALAQLISDVLAFSGDEDAQLDVGFFRDGDDVTSRLARTGLRFDLPDENARYSSHKGPGMDPDKPPILT